MQFNSIQHTKLNTRGQISDDKVTQHYLIKCFTPGDVAWKGFGPRAGDLAHHRHRECSFPLPSLSLLPQHQKEQMPGISRTSGAYVSAKQSQAKHITVSVKAIDVKTVLRFFYYFDRTLFIVHINGFYIFGKSNVTQTHLILEFIHNNEVITSIIYSGYLYSAPFRNLPRSILSPVTAKEK